MKISGNLDEHLVIQTEDNALAMAAMLYTEPSVLALEQQSIFENHWQLVGHIEQLQSPGDQIVAQVGRIPIVVVKNQTNQIKAFHNVCRHRAGPLALKNGNDKALRCKYHGWTYTLDGALRSAPEMNSTPNFNVCQHHLPEVMVEQWQGFVFVCITPNPPPLNDVLVDIADNIKPIDLSQLSFSHRDEYIIDCNWKVYMDNYLEGYHLPHVHPGLNKLLDYRSYNTSLYPWYSYQYSPLENTANGNVDNFYGDGQAHYYCIFPNLMLNILPGRLQTNVILPIDHKKTKVIFDYFYAELNSSHTQQLIAKDREFSDQVQEEDITICEQVQKGLDSGSYHAGRLCMKRETGVLHYQNLIRRSLHNTIFNHSE